MTTIFNNFTKKLILFTLILIFILSIFNSKLVVFSVKESCILFFNNLFGPIFIFYTLSDLLINYNILKVFKLNFFNRISKFLNINPNSLFIIFFSMITGFPSGSKYITDFYNKKLINYTEAIYLLTFTHFSNPLFILNTIGILFGKNLSIKILCSTFLSNLVLAIILRPKNNTISYTEYKTNHSNITLTLTNSFRKTYQIIMIVLSNSIIFTTVGYIITKNIDNSFYNLFVFGLLDLTKGITLLSKFNLNNLIKGILLCTLISFGGINVNIQVKSIIEKEKLPYIYFLSGRIIATFLSILIYFIINYFL